MAKQTINIGSAANDGTGSTLRAAFDITNDNFTELYDGSGGLLHKIEGTNFTGSLLVGHSTTGTLSSSANNTGIGIGALDALTSGDSNVAIGKSAGTSLTSGGHNVAIGHDALATEDEHGTNIAIGTNALYALNAGVDAYNIAVGYNAGKLISTGLRNTIMGGLAGDAITTGSDNTAIGYAALSSSDTGSRTVAIGSYALEDQNPTGADYFYNVAIGYAAGKEITTGANNTTIGGLAGDALTTGSNNTVIGYNAAASAVDVSNEVTIGNSSVANVRIPADSTLKIGASGDLQLEHLSSNSFIKNTAVGDLYIENQVDDASIIFRCDDGSGGLDTYFTVVGAGNRVQYNKDLRLIDNVDLSLGSSDDLKILHNATASYIQNFTGDLQIQNNSDGDDILFKCDDGSGGLATYFYLNGGDTNINFQKDTLHSDSVKAKFGTSADLQIFHSSGTNIIDSTIGDLIVKVSQDDGDIIFQSDNGSGGIDTYFRLDGGQTRTEFEKATQHLDNVIANFGSSSDLQIYHNATDSYILNGTGDLEIINNQDDGDIIFKSDDGSGGTTAYLTLDGGDGRIKIPDQKILQLGAGGDLQFQHNSTDSLISNYTGHLYIQNHADDKQIIFQNDDGSGGVETYFYLDGLGGGSAPFTVFPDAAVLAMGNNHDTYIQHTGAHFKIDNYTGDIEISNQTDDGDLSLRCDNGSGGTKTYIKLDGGIASTLVSTDLLMVNDGTDGIIKFGASQDLQIQHNGTDSQITNTTGHLQFTNTADDKDISFASDNGSGGDTIYLTLDGGDVSTIVHTIKVLMPNLPTSDPSVAGQLYTDSGTLKVSAG